MTGLRVPVDTWAERAVAGCAVASARGARLAADRLGSDPAVFYEPPLARLYAAALDVDSDDVEERIRLVAAVSGVRVEEVREIVEDRPVQWDTAGGFARRVLDAARRRDVMTAAAELYNQLGQGATLDEIQPALLSLAAPA